MKKPILYLFAITTVFTQGCKLDAPDIETSGGGAVSESYLPLTTGTYWKYSNVISGMAPDTVTIRVTGETSTINGKQFHAVLGTSKIYGAQPAFMYYDNHIALLRSTSYVAGITVNMQLMNDTTAVGHSWTTPLTDNGMVNGVPGRLIGTVAEKGVSKTIGGKTFTNVINTKVDLQYDIGLGGGFETYGTYHFYLAKGVGLIEIDSEAMGVEIGKERIIDYSIK